jgi:hypothetical protein
MSISGNTVTPTPTPTLQASLEVFTETDDANPLHVNYDFTKSEPLTIITEEDILPKKNNKVKKSYIRDVRSSKRRHS